MRNACKGESAFIIDEAEDGVLEPEKSKIIKFCFAVTSVSKLLEHTIIVQNDSCPPDEHGNRPVSSLTIQCILDDGAILLSPPSEENGENLDVKRSDVNTIVMHKSALIRPCNGELAPSSIPELDRSISRNSGAVLKLYQITVPAKSSYATESRLSAHFMQDPTMRKVIQFTLIFHCSSGDNSK